MEIDVLFRIIALASAAGTYALCFKNATRYLLSKNGDVMLLKMSLMTVGFFTALIMGFVMLIDAAGIIPASIYAVIVLILAIAADTFFRQYWRRQAHAQKQMMEDLKRVACVKQSTSLEEACGKTARRYDLTRREEVVLGFLLQGLSYAQIEENLFLSHSTVKSHVRNLYRKMGVNRRERLFQKVHGIQESEGSDFHRTPAETLPYVQS